MQDLGTLGGSNSYANDINDSGQVVGYSETDSGGQLAFLYENGQMIGLDTRLVPEDRSWQLQTAVGINNGGEIVVFNSSHDGDGVDISHALLVTPTSYTPPPNITSPNKTNTYDSDGSFSVSGSAIAGSTVKLYDGNAEVGSATASTSGNWEHRPHRCGRREAHLHRHSHRRCRQHLCGLKHRDGDR